jgi:hypothetical protein
MNVQQQTAVARLRDVSKKQGISPQKLMVMLSVVSAGMTAGAANAAIDVPQELLDVFTDLAVAFGTLVAAGAVLFGVIRGTLALFKIASRVFSAAGA